MTHRSFISPVFLQSLQYAPFCSNFLTCSMLLLNIEYKDVIHERDLKANRFHVEEVKELRERILLIDSLSKDKDDYYKTIEETVEAMNHTIPKLINDKLDLKAQVKEEEQKNMFMRHEMIKMKEKHLAEIGDELKRHAVEINRLEQKRIDMGAMYDAEIKNYLTVISGKDKRILILKQTI